MSLCSFEYSDIDLVALTPLISRDQCAKAARSGLEVSSLPSGCVSDLKKNKDDKDPEKCAKWRWNTAQIPQVSETI